MNTCLVTTMLSQFFLFAVKGDFEPEAVLVDQKYRHQYTT